MKQLNWFVCTVLALPLGLGLLACDSAPKAAKSQVEPNEPEKGQVEPSEPEPSEPEPNAPEPNGPAAAPISLENATFAGGGFEGTYNEVLESWTLEHWVPNADGGNDDVGVIYLDQWNSEHPVEMKAFVAEISKADFIDAGSTWTIEREEATNATSWLVRGVADDGEDKQQAFALRLDPINALCRGYAKTGAPDPAAEIEAMIAVCNSVVVPGVNEGQAPTPAGSEAGLGIDGPGVGGSAVKEPGEGEGEAGAQPSGM